VEVIPCECSLKVEHDVVVLSKLKLLADCIDKPYLSSFVSNYLLLKLNNLWKFSPHLHHFINHLATFYNHYVAHPSDYQFR
jgi:hypothetical protein